MQPKAIDGIDMDDIENTKKDDMDEQDDVKWVSPKKVRTCIMVLQRIPRSWLQIVGMLCAQIIWWNNMVSFLAFGRGRNQMNLCNGHPKFR